MIKSIRIKDYVLIDELEVNFDSGLNILTGETGSGKSVIIDAIDLAFGARASKDQIKTGSDKALIELYLELNRAFPLQILEENGIDIDDNMLVISREITQNASRSRVNGVLVQQAFVQNLRTHLIDIHSQHETYNYIHPKTHAGLLDNYGSTEHKSILDAYKQTYTEYIAARNKLELIRSQIHNSEQRIDFLKFQIDEITNASITDINEYESLLQERTVLLNVEELKNISYSGYESLYNQDGSIIDVLNTLKTKIAKASELDENLSEHAEIIGSCSANLKEVAGCLRNYSENLEIDEQKLCQTEERIELLDKLKRKYGPELSDVLNNLEKFENELSQINFSDEQVKELAERVKELGIKAENLAEKLSQSRKILSTELSGLIQKKLVRLEMPKVKFSINVENLQAFSHNGKDDVEFLISPNIGEPLKPLAKIASGGEISRVMLAVKTIFARADNVNTVIFDEIDSGISGKTSQAVAETLAELSLNHQTVCITHQPIIAAFADKHLYIRKEQNDKATNVLIDDLSSHERINALASMASGFHNDSESQMFAARLLEQASYFKDSYKQITA